MDCCILIGQSNNTNSLDWLKFDIIKAGLSVFIRILKVENIFNLCKACVYKSLV